MAVALALAAMAVYASVSPEQSPWFPRCIFLSLTGYRCPGCGLQRSLHSLLNLDFAGAVGYNAFLILLALPLMALYFADAIAPGRLAQLHKVLTNRFFIIAIGLATLAWWIFRNIAGM
ncbi:MAG: DUF2752 domain-containing protein [Candidatus Cryptobacteroides sp.]